MLPSEASSLSFATIVLHSYYKQNDILFIASIWLYSTTLIYHYTKRYLSISDRIRRPVYYIDVLSCIAYWFATLYDHITIHSLDFPHSVLIYGMHIGLPVLYLSAGYSNRMMWSVDPIVSDRWHAIFHLLIQLESHIYLRYQR